MRLPSSSSILLSLAVSSSSSSLSALAAPTGDCPDSSSAAVKRDDMTGQSDNHPLSRGLLDDLAKLLPPPLDGTVEKLLGLPGDKPPKARADPSSLAVGSVAQQAAPLTHKLVHARMVTRAEDGDPDEHPSSPSPAAPGDGPKPPAAPAGAPQLPSDLPVEPPALVPEPPKPPVGRRDQGGVSGVPMIGHMLSPNIPRNPPNTPVPRQLLSPDGLSLPVNFPGQ